MSTEAPTPSPVVSFDDADIAVAVADLYARAARLREELAPLGVTVTVSVDVRISR